MVKLPNRQNTLGQNRSNPTGLPSGAVRSPLEGLGAGMQKLARNLEIVEKGKKDAEKILEINRAKGLMRARFMEIDDELRDRKHGKVDSSEFLKREANKYTAQMIKEEFKPEYHAEIDVVKQSLLNIQTVKTMQFEREDRTARVKTGISRVYNETASAISQDPDNYERLMEEGSLTLAGTLSALNMNQSDAHDEMLIQKREWVESAIESYSSKGQMSKAFALLKKEGARFADHNKIKEDIRKGYLANQKFIDGQKDREIERAKEKDERDSQAKVEEFNRRKILAGNNIVLLKEIEEEEHKAVKAKVISTVDLWKTSKPATKKKQDEIDRTLVISYNQKKISGVTPLEIRRWLNNPATRALYSKEGIAKIYVDLASYSKAIKRTSSQMFSVASEFVAGHVKTERHKKRPDKNLVLTQRQLYNDIIGELARKTGAGEGTLDTISLARIIMAEYGRAYSITKTGRIKGDDPLYQSNIPDIRTAIQNRIRQVKKLDTELVKPTISDKERKQLRDKRDELWDEIRGFDDKKRDLQETIEHEKKKPAHAVKSPEQIVRDARKISEEVDKVIIPKRSE